MGDDATAIRTMDLPVHQIVPAMLDDFRLPQKSEELRTLPPITTLVESVIWADEVAHILECGRWGGHVDQDGRFADADSERFRRYCASHIGFAIVPLLDRPLTGDLVARVAGVYEYYEYAVNYKDRGGFEASVWDPDAARLVAHAVVAHAQHTVHHSRSVVPDRQTAERAL